MADFGHHVADCVGIGTLEEFDRLLAALHQRGIRLILNFVPSHGSDEHPWFRDARASRESARREWYIWRDSAPGAQVYVYYKAVKRHLR
jgi:alpha-glucosidase